jgi:hypothetical protein
MGTQMVRWMERVPGGRQVFPIIATRFDHGWAEPGSMLTDPRTLRVRAQ